jgi:hypothetical protein
MKRFIVIAFVLSLVGDAVCASSAVVIDFEHPLLTNDRQIVNPYLYSSPTLTVEFTTPPGSFGDGVVGLVKNSATSACVEPSSSDQKLGTGRSDTSDGSIGLAASPIQARFKTPLAAPATISVDFQTVAGPQVRLRLLDAAGQTIATSTAPTPAARGGTCGFPGLPRSRVTVTATAHQPVFSAVMDLVGTQSVVFVIDNFTVTAPTSAAGGSCVGVPNGLVAWWPFDEAQGPTAHELVAAHHGQYAGTPTPASGEVGRGLSFGGGADYVEVPDTPLLNPGTGDFSIDAWIMPTQIGGVRVILDKRSVSTNGIKGYELFLYNGRLGLQLADGTYANYISKLAVVKPDGKFHHVAATVARNAFGPQGITFYLDGMAQDSFNANAHNGDLGNLAPLRLGATSNLPGSFWAGALDEVEIFNRELRPAEVSDIANAQSAGKCKCATVCAPVAWWTFDERSGNQAADIAAHFSGPHDATIVGSALHPPGKVGRGLRFAPPTFVTVANDKLLDPDLQQGSGYTIDAWIRTSQAEARLAGKIFLDLPIGFLFYLRGGLLSFEVNNSAGGSCDPGPACPNVADDAWHLVGATITHDAGGKNTVVRLYVDGRLAQTFPPVDTPVGFNGGPFLIGGVPPVLPGQTPIGAFDGTIDELEIFDHALTEDDFSAIFNAGGAGKCKPAVRPQPCGVPGDSPCAAGQFCDFLLAAACGVVPVGGLCRDRPGVCLFDEVPTCGCDGVTYSGTCNANLLGVSVAYPGACHP